VTAKVLLLDRVANLIEEGIDVGLRVGSLPDSTLIARHVGEVRRVLVASPSYLAKNGAPKARADLKAHSIIAFTGLVPRNELRFGHGRSANRITLAPRFEINDAPAAIAAAEQGEGIMLAVSYMVAEQLRSGRLVLVLDKLAPPPVPVQLVYPESRLVAPKVRAFIDYAAPRIRTALERAGIPVHATKRRSSK
jgi:DNA-binding transcriptional LysR family regulator